MVRICSNLAAQSNCAKPYKFFICCRLVTDRDTGKPKGFAFCEFFDIPTASAAQRNLNNFEMAGRHIHVDFAEDRDSKGDRRDGERQPSIASDKVNHFACRLSEQRFRPGEVPGSAIKCWQSPQPYAETMQIVRWTLRGG